LASGWAAAAQEQVDRNPDMYHFPSYEMITVCTRNRGRKIGAMFPMKRWTG